MPLGFDCVPMDDVSSGAEIDGDATSGFEGRSATAKEAAVTAGEGLAGGVPDAVVC